MDLEHYLEGLRFRFFRNNFPMALYTRLDALAARIGRKLEITNSRLPVDETAMKLRLQPLCDIPRMSTFVIGAVINHAVREMGPEDSFVNVGVWNGFTLLCGMADNPDRRCVGIDNFSQFGGPREEFLERFHSRASEQHRFYDMDYRDYFRQEHSGKIGVYIYDGEHSYRNQLEGLRIAEPHLSEDAIIIVDDTNWEMPRRATLDFMDESTLHYRVLFDEETCFPGHPTYWNGLMVLRRVASPEAAI
jgi:hypothetical protein